MLEYLDRSPKQLSAGPRKVVLALRGWARDVRCGVCPIAGLRRCLGPTMPSALAAHALFHCLCASALQRIDLGCPCCGKVSDDEALILAIVFAPTLDIAGRSLRSLVRIGAIEGAAAMAQGLAARLAPLDARRAA